jgi:hypothetical protein
MVERWWCEGLFIHSRESCRALDGRNVNFRKYFGPIRKSEYEIDCSFCPKPGCSYFFSNGQAFELIIENEITCRRSEVSG